MLKYLHFIYYRKRTTTFLALGKYNKIINSYGKLNLLFLVLIIILAFTTLQCYKGNPVSSDKVSNGKIVFIRHDSLGGSFIFTMDLNGENLKQLTFPNELLDTTDFPTAGHYRGSASEPRWSPDGKKIAYSESLGPDESHIVIMNADGSGKKSLTYVGSYAVQPKWSPLGDRILYLRGGPLGAITAVSIVDTNGVYYGGSSFDIHIAPDSKTFDGDDILYDITEAQWYPDGQHLYIIGNIGNFSSIPACGESTTREIYLLELATGNVNTRLTHNNIDECGFEISPDGSRIAVTRGPYQTDRKIYLMSVNDTSLSAITTGKNDNWPRWSNNGKYIVYTKDINNDPYRVDERIFLINPVQPLKETQVSFIEGEEPDIFINSGS